MTQETPNINTRIREAFGPNVLGPIRVGRHADLHGSKAVEVHVELRNGKIVKGTFTTEDKDSFGGVEFSSRKDVAGLMIAKINAVLDGTAEEVQ